LETVIAGFGPRGELPSPSLSSPPPPLSSSLCAPCYPVVRPLRAPSRAPATRSPGGSPAPWRPRAPSPAAPRPAPPRPAAPCSLPRWLAHALVAPCPGGYVPWRPRAPVAARPGGPAPWCLVPRWPCAPVVSRPDGRALSPGAAVRPRVASRAPDAASRVPSHATVVARCLIFDLIHFKFSLVNMLRHAFHRATN
jgi:hypothetical protein